MLYEAKQLYLVRTGSPFLSEKTSWLYACKAKRHKTNFLQRNCNIFHEVKGVTGYRKFVHCTSLKCNIQGRCLCNETNFCLNPYPLHAHLFKSQEVMEL